VLWNPDSAVFAGHIAVTWAATCHSNRIRYCDQLPSAPPPEGTAVTFRDSMALTAELIDPPESPSTEAPPTSPEPREPPITPDPPSGELDEDGESDASGTGNKT
jgi:hypothetical protein